MDGPLDALVERVAERLTAEPPHIVGIGGAVAAGKSTIAAVLAEGLERSGRRVDVVATDAFLYPNVLLAERELTFRKGFPETFDGEAILRFVSEIRDGATRVEIPVYSHEIYDIVPDERAVIDAPDLVLIEGVIALQPPLVEGLDVSIYVDADEADVREWFVTRFLALTEAARSDESSFYRMFADLDADGVRRVAEGTWDSINGINLREHIAPSRSLATFVVRKARDHTVIEIVAA